MRGYFRWGGIGLLGLLAPLSLSALVSIPVSPPSILFYQVQGEAGGANGTLSELIRRPQWGEAPRYPQDTVIGSLGRGSAPEAAYRFARNFLDALLGKNRESPALAGLESPVEDLFQSLAPAAPRKYRIGGGREEPDGTVSFLFRFLGRDQSIAGELYLRQEDEVWRVDDVLIEELQDIGGEVSESSREYVPYERFF